MKNQSRSQAFSKRRKNASRRRRCCLVERLEDRRLLSADGWVVGMGETDAFHAQAMDVDSSGNVYVASYQAGLPTIRLSKSAPDGQTIHWSKTLTQFGANSSYYPHATDLVVDSDGSSYVVGIYESQLDLDGDGLPDVTSNGGVDAFLIKYDTDGNLVWSKSWGSTGANFDEGHSVTILGSTLYFSGRSQGDIDIDGAVLSKPREIDSGGAFAVALDTVSGNVNWATHLGVGAGETSVTAVDNGGSTSVYAVAGYNIVRIDANSGAVDWTEAINGWAGEIASDEAGNLFVMGSFSGPQQFGNQTLNGLDGSSTFIVGVNDNGTGIDFDWATEIVDEREYSAPGDGGSLAVHDGVLYATGAFYGGFAQFSDTITLHRGLIPTNLDYTGILARYRSSDGTVASAQTVGMTSRALAVHSSHVYVTGAQERGSSYPVSVSDNEIDAFLPEPLVDGERDIFVVKLNPESPAVRIGELPNVIDVSGQVTLTAVAHSIDGAQSYTDIHWRSQLQGYLGVGTSLTTTLDPGRHEITAYVVDSVTALKGVAGREVQVLEESPLLAADDFETGDFSGGSQQWAFGQWSAQGAASVTTDSPLSGSYNARLRAGTGDLIRMVDLTGVANAQLSFGSRLNSFEKNDKAWVKTSPDGVNWTNVREFGNGDDDNQYHVHSIVLQDVPDTLYIRFDAGMNKSDDEWFIDDVLIEVIDWEGPPAAGITVTPVSGLVTGEDGTTDSFTVVLDAPPTDDVVIGIASDNPSEGVTDVTSLTFTTANWDLPQAVTVSGVDDVTPSEDGDIAYNIVTAAAVSADAAYSGLNAADVTVTNLDDDLNHAPVALDDVAATDQDIEAIIDVLANDSDPEGADLSIVSVGQPADGSVVLNADQTLTYTPNPGFSGSDAFSYEISDGDKTDQATVTVTVRDNSVAPMFVGEVFLESRKGGRYRAVFVIHDDNNDPLEGVQVDVIFAGQTYSGFTDDQGRFRTNWVKLRTGESYLADVTDLVFDGFDWNDDADDDEVWLLP